MLLGNKVTLRPLRHDDIKETQKWRNDLDLIKNTQGIRYPKTYEMENEWFDFVLNDKNNRNIYFAIEIRETGTFIGIIHLNNIDYISRTGTIGIFIGDKEMHGKGYSSESVKLLLDYSGKYLDLRKILAYIISYNVPSIRMFIKIGFKEEACLKKHVYYSGEYHDVIIYSYFLK